MARQTPQQIRHKDGGQVRDKNGGQVAGLNMADLADVFILVIALK